MRTIENWSVVSTNKNFFNLEPGNFVVGELDGKEIITSAIFAVEDEYIATSHGSIYRLGRSSSAYEAFVNQKEVTMSDGSGVGKTQEFNLEDEG